MILARILKDRKSILISSLTVSLLRRPLDLVELFTMQEAVALPPGPEVTGAWICISRLICHLGSQHSERCGAGITDRAVSI